MILMPRKAPWFADETHTVVYVPVTTDIMTRDSFRRKTVELLGVTQHNIASARLVDMAYDEDTGKFVECSYDTFGASRVWKVSLR